MFPSSTILEPGPMLNGQTGGKSDLIFQKTEPLPYSCVFLKGACKATYYA